MNLTITVDDELLRRARIRAVTQGTSVNAILRDAGIEVVYLGIHQSADQIVTAALEEDVDVIGLSSLGGTHLAHCREVIDLLAANKCRHLPVVVGGTIPVEDFPVLEASGVKAILRPGSPRQEIVETIETLGRAARLP